jgi:hypothetical protein
MTEFPNAPATEVTTHKCVVLWVLESAHPEFLTQDEINIKSGEIIDAKLGPEKRTSWPPFNGTDEVYAHLEDFGDVERVRPVHWRMTNKGLQSLRDMERRFLKVSV